MKKMSTILSLLLLFAFASPGFAGSSGDRTADRRSPRETKLLKPVKFAPYSKECGACHFAYQPELLPARSWDRMMNTLEDHFGTDASLDGETAAEISVFLQWESAENSTSRKAQKFLNSIRRNETPLRISETRYFRTKHDEIRPDVYTRGSIGSAAHCAKCHTTAEEGNYEDDFVRIPER